MAERRPRVLDRRDRVILGGADLEMREIARLLRAAGLGTCIVDRRLRWGARASAVRREIAIALAGGGRAILVELTDDLPPTWPRGRLYLVDHHGARAGRDAPSSIEQIYALIPPHLRPPWSRRRGLVVANDIGHIALMRQRGAAPGEITRLRSEDRAAQGADPFALGAAREALRQARCHGRILEVAAQRPALAALADAADPVFGGPSPEILFVRSPHGVSCQGPGDIIMALASLPGSWWGGALPGRGYWGGPPALEGPAAALLGLDRPAE